MAQVCAVCGGHFRRSCWDHNRPPTTAELPVAPKSAKLQHRKHRGYATQRLVADYLAANGWPYAEPVGAGRPGSDITGTPDLAIEVKARAGFDPLTALRQAADAADGRLPFAVLRMNGQGPASVAEFVAVIRFGDLIAAIKEGGYGDA